MGNMLVVKTNDLERVKETLAIGSSSFARQGSASIVAIFINNSLMYYVENRMLRFMEF